MAVALPGISDNTSKGSPSFEKQIVGESSHALKTRKISVQNIRSFHRWLRVGSFRTCAVALSVGKSEQRNHLRAMRDQGPRRLHTQSCRNNRTEDRFPAGFTPDKTSLLLSCPTYVYHLFLLIVSYAS